MDKNNLKLTVILFFSLVGVFIIDQNIKTLFVNGFRYYTNCIDFILVYNKGVAFSMFAFLDGWLKYLQIIMVIGVFGYILRLKQICYAFPTGLILGGAISNIYDRFIHSGVVDMVYWHCGFDFAVFNFADVMIDIGVVYILFLNFKPKFCKN